MTWLIVFGEDWIPMRGSPQRAPILVTDTAVARDSRATGAPEIPHLVELTQLAPASPARRGERRRPASKQRQPAAAAACGPSQPSAAKRSRWDERRWADIRRAAEIARDTGVQLVVHGVTITAAAVRQPQPAAAASGGQQRTLAAVEATQPARQAATDGMESPPPGAPQPLSRRQLRSKQRSQQRLAEFQSQKRKLLISQSQRISQFLRQFRRNRMHLVYTVWQLQQKQDPEQRAQQQLARWISSRPVGSKSECGYYMRLQLQLLRYQKESARELGG